MTYKILLGLSLSIGITGCVGVTNIKSAEKHVSFNPDLIDGTIRGGSKRYTKEEVAGFWGEADEHIIAYNGWEGWIYNNRMAWGGAVIWVIIPIPLVVPIGYRSTTVYFDNNMTKGTLYEYAQTPTNMCSLLPIMWIVNGSTNSWCHSFID
ncbi:hypothetical protein HUE87_08975 [Candidatus Sulfurimonas marisnigri]|uniref:Lipoprotein n=1 Tax=Candidatus Sulfurimonas marisnigri TaxID=2740405 RepID=A0A7S7M0K3_9BACT|nr:hypothetical protein [Candidatus Sulfurimonas marisnigri]QOY54019.1 hypothetical protein HUE87_08975 [Candidatus Sulfurimonas marisnigri]